MPLKVNGLTISWGAVASVIALTAWLVGVSWQGKLNAEDLDKLENVPEQIILLRAEQADIAAAIKAIAKALGVEVAAATAPLINAADSGEDGG